MYFNEGNNDTNIDSSFNEKEEKGSRKISKKVLIIIISGVSLILVLGIILFLVFTKYSIKLVGNNKINICLSNNYIEPGYSGYDRKKKDLTNDVVVNGNVDTSTIGKYTVTYTLNNKKVKRTVNVMKSENCGTYIHLLGGDVVLEKGETYNEPGYVVIDTKDGKISDRVISSNNINNSVSGTYEVVYFVTNSSGISSMSSRKVIVR